MTEERLAELRFRLSRLHPDTTICAVCESVFHSTEDHVGDTKQDAVAVLWRSMSTAPKDGREVLLKVKYRAGIPGQCLVGHYMPGGYCIEDHPSIREGWYFWNGCMFDQAAEPTHWMPIPDEQATDATPQPAPRISAEAIAEMWKRHDQVRSMFVRGALTDFIRGMEWWAQQPAPRISAEPDSHGLSIDDVRAEIARMQRMHLPSEPEHRALALALSLQWHLDRVLVLTAPAAECFICGKQKGRAPERCPGHYEVIAEPAPAADAEPSDAEMLDYLESEWEREREAIAQHRHYTPLFRANKPITRKTICDAMRAAQEDR